MKKYFLFVIAAIVAVACSTYDDTELRDKVTNLENRVTALEALSNEITNLKTLVSAIENKDYVTGVSPIMEGGVQVGYAIMFTQSGTVEIRYGKDGQDGVDGVDGHSPVISAKQDTDGLYYWAIDGVFTDPKLRVEGVTPEFKIDEEAYICVSYDHGTNWVKLGKSGASVEANFDVTYDQDNVYIEFTDEGELITLPRYKEFALSIARSGNLGIDAGATLSIPYVLTNADETVVVETLSEGGYKVVVNKTSDSEGTIDVTAPSPLVDGKVLVFANKGDKTCMKALLFEEGEWEMAVNAFEVSEDGGKVKVEYTTNYGFNVEIPAEAQSWLSLAETKAAVADWVSFYALYNETGETRTADVKFVTDGGDVLTTVTISQPAAEGTYIRALFGWQALKEYTCGFDGDANRTMAAVGDYLILSNAYDFSAMPVYNRMTGDYMPSVKVNTAGIANSDEIHAITTDDAGHLVAATYVSTVAAQETESTMIRIYVWENGITSAPTKIFEKDLYDAFFENAPVGVNKVQNLEMFRTVGVSGDLTTGKAVVTTATKNVPRPVFIFFNDGVADETAYIEWPNGDVQISMWNSTKVVPMTADKDNLEYFWSTGNFRKQIVNVKSKEGLGFTCPTSHFWSTDGTYANTTWCVDAIDINGKRLIAVQNGKASGGTNSAGGNLMWHRLYVAVLPETPVATSLTDGFLFDSREGSAEGTDAVPGSGYAETGIAVQIPGWRAGTLCGENLQETGDVIFAAGADGHSVQVYMLVTGNHLMAYNIPFSKF